MASLNKVMLIGNLGRDPEIRHTQAGTAVATLSVATNERWNTNEGEKAERTEWHRVIAFGKLAEICGQHLAKGRTVYVEGRLQTQTWEKDGDKRSVTEIVAGSVQFLGGNGKNASTPASEPPPVRDSDIPF
ncbi:MAG: single-stranded DNA-binding protein [bacterium]